MIPLLAADCGVPALQADAQGVVAVAFGVLVVNLRPHPDPECVSLDARLGTVDRLEPETWMAMMADNRWPQESLAGALAVDAAGTVFLVHHLSGRCLSFTRFRAILNRFATQGERWRQRLAADAQTPSTPAPDPALLQVRA
jgi:hypothetical protein